ncbi:MAG: hypothetical protein GF364_20625 [Candidatus Lokiarchaeota archaeon]|nr:hypothetical protein [Candidatus Lokiarchaeota archaeon]
MMGKKDETETANAVDIGSNTGHEPQEPLDDFFAEIIDVIEEYGAVNLKILNQWYPDLTDEDLNGLAVKGYIVESHLGNKKWYASKDKASFLGLENEAVSNFGYTRSQAAEAVSRDKSIH